MGYDREKSGVNLVDPYALIRAMAALSVFFMHASVFAAIYGFSFDESDWILCTAAHSAVWVFIFLAGCFNTRGFLGETPRYELTGKGILAFYRKRAVSVIVPVWFFQLIALTVSEPDFVKQHPAVIIRLLTLTYTGEPGCASIAATWYVSTIFWLYLLTPLLALAVRKAGEHFMGMKASIPILLIVMAGLAFRYVMYRTGADWTQRVFVPFYSNLDIYAAGGAASLMSHKGDSGRESKAPAEKVSPGFYIASILFFLAVSIAANRFYFMKTYDERYLTLYRYGGPGAVCIIMSIMALLISKAGYVYTRADRGSLKKNPFRIIDLFSYISFEFYLVHSMVLFHVSGQLRAATPKAYYGKLLLTGGMFSVMAACLFKAVTKGYNVYIFRKQKGKNSG